VALDSVSRHENREVQEDREEESTGDDDSRGVMPRDIDAEFDLSLRKSSAAASGKVVPITGKQLHYLDPSPHAVKRKNTEAGSEFGRYRNRFQKFAVLSRD
jgi:hypothetical protein